MAFVMRLGWWVREGRSDELAQLTITVHKIEASEIIIRKYDV